MSSNITILGFVDGNVCINIEFWVRYIHITANMGSKIHKQFNFISMSEFVHFWSME